MNKAIGIDLGTTYCCVGIYNNGKVEIISNDNGEKIIPSFISLSDDSNSNILIGSEAKKNTNLKTIYDVKRLIGKDYSKDEYKYLSYNIINKDNKPYINFLNKDMSPEELSSLILISSSSFFLCFAGYFTFFTTVCRTGFS